MSDTTADTVQRPVIALMGEFSAGKSTLANLLLGEGRSPVKVTATQLPPVWFSYGMGEPYTVGLDGTETPIRLEDLESVDVASTSHIRVFMTTELLELMDLIDMPGNSDPNMSADVWKRTIHHASGVIWCTHANQAWRQSEAAVWEDLPEELYKNSLLLLTRFDKIIGDTNRMRVVRRVKSETEDLFRGVFPISLTEALGSGDNREQWENSGAEEFITELLEIVMNAEPPEAPEEEEPEAEMVLPRRVARAAGEKARTRPVRDEGERPVA